MTRWGVHFCPLHWDTRTYVGLVWRLHIFTPWGQLILAFSWRDRTQLWLPWKTKVPWPPFESNYSRWRSPIVWHPPSKP